MCVSVCVRERVCVCMCVCVRAGIERAEVVGRQADGHDRAGQSRSRDDERRGLHISTSGLE